MSFKLLGQFKIREYMRQGRCLSLRRYQLPKRKSGQSHKPNVHQADVPKAVLQCLYSQCQTTHFATALHYAIDACPGSALDSSDTLPPFIRHQGLRKRNNPANAHGSGARSASVSASAVHLLARRSASGSLVASSRPTRSIANFPVKTHLAITTFPATQFESASSVQASNTFKVTNESRFEKA